MTNLQNEVLKLLDESKIEESKELLDEASFEDIVKAKDEINVENLVTIADLSRKFSEECSEVVKSMKTFLKTVNTAQETFNDQKSKNPAAPVGMINKIKAKVGEIRDRADNKQVALHSLKSASRMVAQAQDSMGQAQLYYGKLNRELKQLAASIEKAQKLISSKTSWVGRNFGFWD